MFAPDFDPDNVEPVTEAEVLDALPKSGFLHDYVHFAANESDAHLGYHMVAGLIGLTTTTPQTYMLKFGRRQKHWANMYGLCVGGSGDARKSSSLSIMKGLLREAFPDTNGGIGEVPNSRAGAIESLAERPQQLLIYSEFGDFLANTKNGQAESIKTMFTEVWEGGDVGRRLVRSRDPKAPPAGPTEARDPRLSLIGACTVEFLEEHTNYTDWAAGFLARFYTFFGVRARTYAIPPEQPDQSPALIQQLRERENARQVQFDGRGTQFEAVGFDPQARKMWEDWYMPFDEALRKGRVHKRIAGVAARAHGHALRLALLLAWDNGRARQGVPFELTLDELVPALKMISFHMRSIAYIGRSLVIGRDMQDRRAVLGALADYPRSLGEIAAMSNMLIVRLNPILQTLKEEGMVVQVSDDPTLPSSSTWYRRMTPTERREKFQRTNVIQIPVQFNQPSSISLPLSSTNTVSMMANGLGSGPSQGFSGNSSRGSNESSNIQASAGLTYPRASYNDMRSLTGTSLGSMAANSALESPENRLGGLTSDQSSGVVWVPSTPAGSDSVETVFVPAWPDEEG